jgi:hypothetical protein
LSVRASASGFDHRFCDMKDRTAIAAMSFGKLAKFCFLVLIAIDPLSHAFTLSKTSTSQHTQQNWKRSNHRAFVIYLYRPRKGCQARMTADPIIGSAGKDTASKSGVLSSVLKEACETADEIISSAQLQMDRSAKVLKDAKARKDEAKKQFDAFRQSTQDQKKVEEIRAKCTVEIAEAEVDASNAQASFDAAQALKFSAMAQRRGYADALSDSLLPKAAGLLREAERACGLGDRDRSHQFVATPKRCPRP